MNRIKEGNIVRLVDNTEVLEKFGLETEKEKDTEYYVETELYKHSGFPKERSFFLNDDDGLIYPESALYKIPNTQGNNE